MRFLVDECVGKRVANWLKDRGHHVIDVLSSYLKGSDDRTLLALAHRENLVLITKDRDFGDLIFRDGLDSSGLIWIKDGDMRSSRMSRFIDQAIDLHSDIMENSIIILKDWRIRTGPIRKGIR